MSWVNILGFYFGWPLGAVYSNLLASAICAALVWWRLRAKMIAHHLEQAAQRERHHAEHMDALDLDTPGGLAAVMAEVKDARMAAESAHGAMQGLALVAGTPKPAAAGATRLRKTAAGKTEQAGTPAAGMGSRVPPKTSRGKT